MPRNGLTTYLTSARHTWEQWPRYLSTHVAATAIASVLLWPVMAFMLQKAVSLSGNVALADFEIAQAVLSPVGILALLILGGAFVTISVFETSFMMAIDMSRRRDSPAGSMAALHFIARRLPFILEFGAVLVLRLGLMLLPALAAAALAAMYLLSEHDINFYLSVKPPEFRAATAVIGGAVCLTGLWILYKALSWSLALPLLLFAGERPGTAFSRSARLVRRRHPGAVAALTVWAAVSFALVTATSAILYAASDAIIPAFGNSLRSQAVAIAIATATWALVQALVQGFVNATFAITLTELTAKAAPELITEAAIPATTANTGRTSGTGWIVAAIAGFAVIGTTTGLVTGLVNSLRETDTVQVIAHRAGAANAPENTMAAVRQALSDGADWLEIDVQELADGTLVVMHDRDFMRQAGVPLQVHQATVDDLADLDVGAWFNQRFAGEHPALLIDVLRAAENRIGVLIELKYYGFQDRLEERVAETVELAGMSDSVAVMSLDWQGAMRMRELRPDWPVGLLSARAIGDLTSVGADFLAVNTSMLTSGLVDRAKAADQGLYVWTVNDRRTMSDMISRGVDGLITDYPALAREVLNERATLTPAHRLMLVAGTRLGLTN